MEAKPHSSAPRGIFITFEGGEGAGKTTHIRFLSEKLRERGREVVCLREPGGTAIGEKVRALVLDPANETMVDETELLLYEAARAQITAEVIEPALARGAVVLCDRFADSTVAYQVYGRGLPRDLVERASAFAARGIVPDRTILLVTGGSAKTGLARATHRTGADRLELEGVDFHARVNDGFLELAAAEPARIRVVRSASKKSSTSKAIFAELADLFSWMDEPDTRDDAFFASLDAGRKKGKSSKPAHATSGKPAKGASDKPAHGTHGSSAKGDGSSFAPASRKA